MSKLKSLKKCVFTYVTNNYDKLVQPKVITPGWDYICFSDTPIKTNTIWDVRPFNDIDMKVTCPKRRANAVPMKYYDYIDGSYDIAVCIDGNMEILSDMDKFLEDHNFSIDNVDLMLPKHPQRDCIYDEADAIIKLRKDDLKHVRKHVEYLKIEKYPRNFGLHETGTIVISRKSKNVESLFRQWRNIYMSMPSKRDQMSFDYSWWCNNHNVRILSPGKPIPSSRAFVNYMRVVRLHR